MRRALDALDADPGLATRIALALCVLVTLARVAIALATPAPELVLDAKGYDIAARRLLDQGYYAYTHPDVAVARPEPNAAVLPGYPAWLAAIYAVSGVSQAQPAVSVAQALLGGVALWGVFLIGRLIARPSVGVVATALAAAYPPFWWSYRYALTEDLFTALSVFAVLLLLRGLVASNRRDMVLALVACGIVTALALYVRAALVPWAVIAGVIALVASGKPRREVLVGGAAMAITIVVCFVPWWARNAAIYDTFVPLNTQTASGAALSTYAPDDPARWEDLSAPEFQTDYTVRGSDLAANRRLSEFAQSRTRRLMAEEPLALIGRKARAIAISTATYHPNPFGGFTGWGGATEVFHLALLVLAAVGVWLNRRSVAVWVVAAYPLSLIAVHAATLAYSRYLFPMMPFVIVLAALTATRGTVAPTVRATEPTA